MTTPELTAYIQKQLQSGLDANSIAAQLQTAGWAEQDIQTGFANAQQALSPSPVVASVVTPEHTAATAQQLPPPLRQGRIKTGWMLFRQSLAIIKNNPGLSRYVIISALWTLGGIVILGTIFVADYMHSQLLSYDTIDSSGKQTISLTFLGLIILAIWGLIQTIITYFYAAGLSTHVLSIFRGQQTTYVASLMATRKKIGAIVTFSVISAVVGYIIYLLERIRFVGWILSRLIGAVWSLATAFAIPLIADKNIGGAQATKESILLFKQNWGQTITSRVSLGGLFFIIYFLIAIPVAIGLVLGLSILFGGIGALIAFFLLFISIVIASLIQTLATNVLNVALYYYATYKVIPPNFSGELLASVFLSKKK